MDFHLSIRLLIERIKPAVQVGGREVDVDIAVFFPRAPLVCVSDELKDGVSAAKCLEIVERESEKKAYHNIEHLAYVLHTALKKELPMTLEVMVKVRQLGGAAQVSFAYFPKKEGEAKKPSGPWDDE